MYLSEVELPVRGGVRKLVTERCSRIGAVCPDRKAGRRCAGWHRRWEPRQLNRFDDLIIRAASTDLVPVKVKVNRNRAHWFWVTPHQPRRP